MRQSLAIVATIALVLVLLIALNAASYVQQEVIADTEFNPNRSSYHPGPTGTRAFYEFLQESNYQTVRWRKPLSDLLKGDDNAARPRALIVVGETRVPFSRQDELGLRQWVAEGGRLIFVSRQLPMTELPFLDWWALSARTLQDPIFNPTPNETENLVEGVKEFAPQQPAALTRGVETVLPSRYAARLLLTGKNAGAVVAATAPTEGEAEDGANEDASAGALPGDEAENVFGPAPIVYFADGEGALLLDYPYGLGRVVLLSDPFLVANNGVGRADNLQLAVNLVGAGGGLVAFDEYHHGHGQTHASLLTYFRGTPVPAIAAQLALVVVVLVWARGRRFARPLPAPSVDRRSKLEFITSMAELQMRARAFDLALENIYARTRRVLARVGGIDAGASRSRVAERIAAQFAGVKREDVETLMRECEDAIAGAPTNPRQSVALARRLRALEERLGLRARRREIKQAAEKL